MKREFLEGLELDKEVIDSIMKEHGKTVNDTKGSLATIEQENETLKEQLTQRDTDIKELQSQTGNSEELQTKLDELTTTYEADKQALSAKLEETKLNHGVEMALKDSGAKNLKAVRALLDFDTIKLTDEGLQGLSEQLESVKTENDYMFNVEVTKEEPTKPTIVQSDNPNGNGSGDSDPFADKIASILNQ